MLRRISAIWSCFCRSTDSSLLPARCGWSLPLLVALSACSGGGGAGGGAPGPAPGGGGGLPDQGGGPPAASVTLSVDQDDVAAGATVTLSWSAVNASSCEASGGWSGNRPVSGSERVGPLQDDTQFTLSCSGSGGGGVSRLTVAVRDAAVTDPVNLSLSASPEIIEAGGSSLLSWQSENATGCTASGGWSGDRPLSGSYGTPPASADVTYQLRCANAEESALAMVTVRVGDKIIRWQAPTQNVDGSPVNDLAGYRVHWGVLSRNYTDNLTIAQAGVTEWEVDLPTGEYFFALTAFDAEGNESAYSNEVLKLIP